MKTSSPHTILHSFLYGGACVLLAIDIYFLVIALLSGTFAPVVPLLAGILITGGLLFIVYAEGKARGDDRKEHRRLSRVASQLEQPLQSLEDDLDYLIRQSDVLPAEVRLKMKHMNTKTRVVLENVRDIFLMLRAQGSTVSQEMKVYNACSL